MIQEAYCSYEVSKLLEEKGFNEGCLCVYYGEDCKPVIPHDNNFVCKCPTHQRVMAWLRKEKGIAVVPILSSVLDNEKFLWNVAITVAKTNETYHQGWRYESYERIIEAALKYVFENLI